jgi:hypothetical protein
LKEVMSTQRVKMSLVTAEVLTQVAVPLAVMAAPYACMFITHHARGKGIAKKLVLRQINRTVIRRLAVRATAALPIYGMYMGAKNVARDLARSKDATDLMASKLYGCAAACTAVDVAAQACIASGLVAAHCAGVCGLQQWLVTADCVSLAGAGMACITGLWADLAGGTDA